MGLTKALRGRTYEEFLRDPNFEGGFVGGPPLFSSEQLQLILTSDKIEGEASEAFDEAERLYREYLESSEQIDSEAPSEI